MKHVTMHTPPAGQSGRRYATRAPILASLVLACLFGLASTPAHGAIQMGGHMDFVLENGTTVRVFPEAVDSGNIRPRPVWPRNRKVNTKPPGGDPCAALDKEYKRRLGIRQNQMQAAMEQQKQIKRPNYVRQIPRLKAVNFTSLVLARTKPTGWYYLPTEPRLSYKGELPEATFVKFITDEAQGANSAEGGIFHLMVTYGLTKDEEEELKGLLEEAVPGAVLKGMVSLEPAKSNENFIVTSGTLSDEGFSPNGVLTSGRAPTVAGTKAAIAGRVSSLGAQLMETTFENPTADMSVTFVYDYIVKTPAYRGQVRIDLDKIQEAAECSLKTQDKRVAESFDYDVALGTAGAIFLGPVGALFGVKKKKKVRISRRDLEQAYNTLSTLGAIEIRIDQELPDADVSVIESSLMNMAMESFTNIQKTFTTEQEFQQRRKGDDKDAKKQDPKADTWEVYTLKRKQERMSGTVTLNVEKGVAVYRTHSMTGNMGGLLRDHREEIFDEVLLNDPFFKRGKITVDLDTEALELFEQNMVNNASVQVMVPFSGEPFTDDDVFTRTAVTEGAILKEFTFATRGEHRADAACPFKYMESWSLKGGGKWPPNPQHQCAREMAVTLVPPITTRRIDVEADLSEMESAGIRGADVLLRHTLYGKPKTQTVRFRVAKPEPYVEQTIYVDKDAPEVEYQIILTHAKEGKLPPSGWQPLEDDFVYASLSGMPVSFLDRIKEQIPQLDELLQ